MVWARDCHVTFVSLDARDSLLRLLGDVLNNLADQTGDKKIPKVTTEPLRAVGVDKRVDARLEPQEPGYGLVQVLVDASFAGGFDNCGDAVWQPEDDQCYNETHQDDKHASIAASLSRASKSLWEAILV